LPDSSGSDNPWETADGMPSGGGARSAEESIFQGSSGGGGASGSGASSGGAAGGSPGDSAGSSSGGAAGGGSPGGGPMTAEERTARIEGELDESFGVFDDRIAREQAVLADQRGGGGGNGSGSVGSNDPSGDETASGAAGTGEGGEGDQAGGQGGGDEQGERAGTGSEQTGGGGYGGGARGGSGPKTVPADIPDGSDDDIVARQLREAAMKETDPELREKLWEEYRNYKKSTR
jgi:hypothetical protein